MYYRKLREVESSILVPFVVVVSLGTPDGGSAGVESEVTRTVAAKLIAEGRARLATEEEEKRFRDVQAEAKQEAEAVAAAQRMQVTLVHQTEVRNKPVRSARD